MAYACKRECYVISTRSILKLHWQTSGYPDQEVQAFKIKLFCENEKWSIRLNGSPMLIVIYATSF